MWKKLYLPSPRGNGIRRGSCGGCVKRNPDKEIKIGKWVCDQCDVLHVHTCVVSISGDHIVTENHWYQPAAKAPK